MTTSKSAMETFLSTSWGREYQAGKRSLNNALDCLGCDFPDGRYGWIIKALYNAETDDTPKRLPAPSELVGTQWEQLWEQWSGEPEAKGWKRLASEIEDWANREAKKVNFCGQKTQVVDVEMRHDRSGTTSTVKKTVVTAEFGDAVKTEYARLLDGLGEIWTQAQQGRKSLEPVMLDSFGNPIK